MISSSQFSGIPLLPAFVITGTTVWIFFAFTVALWSVATLILEYHWKNYGMDDEKISRARLLYRGGSAFFITVIFLATLSFSLS